MVRSRFVLTGNFHISDQLLSVYVKEKTSAPPLSPKQVCRSGIPPQEVVPAGSESWCSPRVNGVCLIAAILVSDRPTKM